MGKKKKARRAAEQAAHGAYPGGEGGSNFRVPPAMAGIAATVARQVSTPAGRQMIAGALVAAAGAIAGRDAARPVPPVPPIPPVPPVPPTPSETTAGHAPGFAVGSIDLPPEAAQVIEAAAAQATRAIDAAASAVERWARNLARPTPPQE